MSIKYEEIKKQIQQMPATFIPAIISVICEESIRKKIFKVGGLECFIKKVSIETSECLAVGCACDHQQWLNKGFNYCPICGEYLRPTIGGGNGVY